MQTAAEEEVYVGANITTNKPVKHQVRLSDADTQATTWNITGRNPIEH